MTDDCTFRAIDCTRGMLGTFDYSSEFDAIWFWPCTYAPSFVPSRHVCVRLCYR